MKSGAAERIIDRTMITRPLSLVGRRELFLFLGAYILYSTSRYVSVGDLNTAVGHAEWAGRSPRRSSREPRCFVV